MTFPAIRLSAEARWRLRKFLDELREQPRSDRRDALIRFVESALADRERRMRRLRENAA